MMNFRRSLILILIILVGVNGSWTIIDDYSDSEDYRVSDYIYGSGTIKVESQGSLVYEESNIPFDGKMSTSDPLPEGLRIFQESLQLTHGRFSFRPMTVVGSKLR